MFETVDTTKALEHIVWVLEYGLIAKETETDVKKVGMWTWQSLLTITE